MSSIKFRYITIVTFVTLMAFTLGCASIFPKEAVKPDITPPPAPIIVVVPEKPLVKQVLRKGQPAPYDGIIFDKDSSKEILADLTEARGLKAKSQLQDQLIAAYENQRKLLRESNDLMAQSNEQYRKEIESKRKWGTVKNVASVIGGVAAFALGIWAAK